MSSRWSSPRRTRSSRWLRPSPSTIGSPNPNPNPNPNPSPNPNQVAEAVPEYHWLELCLYFVAVSIMLDSYYQNLVSSKQ